MSVGRYSGSEVIEILDTLDFRNKALVQEFAPIFLDAVAYDPQDTIDSNANAAILNLTQTPLTARQLARLVIYAEMARNFKIKEHPDVSKSLSKFEELLKRSNVSDDELTVAYKAEMRQLLDTHKAEMEAKQKLNEQKTQEELSMYRMPLIQAINTYIDKLPILNEYKNELIGSNEEMANAILQKIKQGQVMDKDGNLEDRLNSKVRQYFESQAIGENLSKSMAQKIDDYKTATQVVKQLNQFQNYLGEAKIDVNQKQIKNNILSRFTRDLKDSSEDISKRLIVFKNNFGNAEVNLAKNLEDRIARFFRVLKDTILNKPLNWKTWKEVSKQLQTSEKHAVQDIKESITPKPGRSR